MKKANGSGTVKCSQCLQDLLSRQLEQHVYSVLAGRCETAMVKDVPAAGFQNSR